MKKKILTILAIAILVVGSLSFFSTNVDADTCDHDWVKILEEEIYDQDYRGDIGKYILKTPTYIENDFSWGMPIGLPELLLYPKPAIEIDKDYRSELIGFGSNDVEMHKYPYRLMPAGVIPVTYARILVHTGYKCTKCGAEKGL